ncbi:MULTISPECIES: MFS transporter [Pseudonocardia]|nr:MULTISPECIES: MFS transporter [Pseudonocardia]OSY39931.1 putative transport protein HsrA [Pseudonocardia autotrophica]TDN74527.1 EmrB/QacA subfamily drug resistance transporter [Pseudonocardia autotrophica]
MTTGSVRAVDGPGTHRVLVSMALAAFMAVLTGTTVTSTLEALGAELGAPISGVVWITVVYLVAASAAVPLVGWLSARWGPARLLQAALVGFALSSLLCGFAWDLNSLVVFRAVQGLSGGLLEPAAIAVVGLVTPADALGRVMGLVSLVINVGPVAGPLIGGALVGAGAWPWIFWLNVPLAVLVGLGAWRLVPGTRSTGDRAAVDVRGLLLLPPGFVLLLLGLNRAGAGSGAPTVAVCVLLGLALLAGYVRHALRAPAPLLDVRLLRIPSFAAALGVMSAVGLVMYTQLTVLPALAVRSIGLGPGWQAFPVAVLGLGLMISMTSSGRVSDTTGPRILVRGGASVTAAAAILILAGHARWPAAAVLAVVFLLGLGFGAVAAPTFAGLYRVLPRESMAQGTAALFIVVQLFASAGVTLVGFLTAASVDPVGTAYGVVAVAALLVVAAARLLPGRPTLTR